MGNSNASDFFIGNCYKNAVGGNRYFRGKIDEFCLTIGDAMYKNDFTPPTEPYIL